MQQIMVSAAGMNAEMAATATSAAASAAGVGTLSGALTGLGVIVKGIGTFLLTNPFGWLVTAIGASAAAVQLFTHDYDKASDKVTESVNAYKTAASEYDSVNSELETTKNRITELQALKADGGITLTEEAELQKLQAQNAELERTVELKKAVAEAQQSQMVDDTIGALEANYAGNSNILETNEARLHSIKKLNKERKELEKELEDSGTSDARKSKISERLQYIDSQVNTYKNAISKDAEQLSGYKDTLQSALDLGDLDPNGVDLLQQLDSVLTGFSDLDATPAEQALSKFDSFFSTFDSTGGIKNLLADANNAHSALNKLGLSLSDFGLEETKENWDYFDQYFAHIKKGAEETAEALEKTNKVDSSLSGMKEAQESRNAGDDARDYISYLNNAKRLYAEGKTGTDDFQSVASNLNKGSQDLKKNTENFGKAYDNLKKYLAVDEDSKVKLSSSSKTLGGTLKSSSDVEVEQLTESRDGMEKLHDDILKVTKASKEQGKTFKTTGELANALEVPASFLELAAGLMQEYEIDTSWIDGLTKSSEVLDQAKEQYSQLQQLYNSLPEGAAKDRLGEKLTGFESQIDKANEDLDSLDTDIILNMQLEYDVATLQAQIDQAKDKAEISNNASDWGETIANQELLKRRYYSEFGFDENTPVPDSISKYEEKVRNLKKQLKDAVTDKDEDLAAELRPQLSDAYGDLLTELGKVEVTVEADDEVTPALDRIEARKELDKHCTITADDQATGILDLWNSKLADPKFAELSAEDQATQVIDEWNEANPNQKVAVIEADDEASKTVDVVNSKKVEDKTVTITAKDETGSATSGNQSAGTKTITITANDQASKTISTVKSNANALSKVRPKITISTNAKSVSSLLNAVKSAISSLNGKTAHTYVYNHTVNTIENKTVTTTANAGAKNGPPLKNGVKAAGSAHSSGSSYAKGSGNWTVGSSGKALVNEVGQEMIVRNGHWFIPNDGYPGFVDLQSNDIIFNAAQTRKLLEHGKIRDYGKFIGAKASGSSFANGTASGMAFADGSSEPTWVDWMERLLDRADRILSKYSKKVESDLLTHAKRMSAISDSMDATKKAISDARTANSEYLKLADKVSLDASLKKAVREGAYYAYQYDEDTNKKIEDYKKWVDAANDAAQKVDDLTESLKELSVTAYDLVKELYESEFSALNAREDFLSNNIDLNEERGYFASAKDYEALMAFQQREIAKRQQEYAGLLQKQQEAVANGAVDKWSKQWWDMQNEIDGAASSIQEAEIDLAKFKQTLNELNWDQFDYAQDRIKKFRDEADFLIDLLKKSDLTDKDGNLTDAGWATISLHNKNFEALMAQAKDYGEEITKLDQMLAEDPSNKNLIERREDLLEQQQKNILAAQDEKDAVLDLVKDANDKLVDSLDDVISAYEDSLDAAKDLYDYQKNIKSSTDNIASIQKQLAAYENDTSEETRARIQQLKVQLQDEKQDLADKEYDHYISMTKQLLSDLKDGIDEMFNERMDEVDKSFEDVIAELGSHESNVSAAINGAAGTVGYNLTSYMNDAVNSSKSTNSILADIKKTVENIADEATHVKLDENGNPILDSNGNVQTESRAEVERFQQRKQTLWDEIWKRVGHIWSYDSVAGRELRKRIANATTDDELNRIGSMYGVRGFAQGGYVADLKKVMTANGDNAIAINTLKRGEAVLSVPQAQLFEKFANNLPQLTELVDMSEGIKLSALNSVPNLFNNISQDIDLNIDIDHVSDYNDLVTQMQRDKNFEKFIQSMTTDRMVGGSKLGKYGITWR